MNCGHMATDLFAGMASAPAVIVTGLALDSRSVRPGDLFCAVPGVAGHGLEHREQAEARGAVAIAYEPVEAAVADGEVPVFAVANLKAQLGLVAARFYGDPSSRLAVIGVTGTNGKSTVTWFVAQALGKQAAVMGTLGWGRIDHLHASSLTTPDAISLQRRLSRMESEGVSSVVMEVSSHALTQHRVGGCRFVGAAVTNVTRDHLDFHASMTEYAAAKARLFAVDGLRFAIVNADDGYMNLFKDAAAADVRVLAVSSQHAADLYADKLEMNTDGLRFELCMDSRRVAVQTGLLGRFNVDNLLTTGAILIALGWDLADVGKALGALTPPRGRMTRLGQRGQPTVVVDYAHTPDALNSALGALRAHGYKLLTCVFGCGGDRDRGKRPEMGAAAGNWSDQVIVTDDNPRHEDGDAIIRDILPGLSDHANVQVQRNRETAIKIAIAATPADGVVVIAGKGHETYQDVAGTRRHCDDIETAQRALEAAA